MIRVCVGAASALWLATTLLRAQAPAATPVASLAAPAAAKTNGRVDYASQIHPILVEGCQECHSAEVRKGGLSVASYADLLEGGRSGAVVRPGASSASLLVDRLTGAVEPQMPKGEDPVDTGRLALIRTWIDEGARATPTSAPAPQPWDGPLTLTRPELPAPLWPSWRRPVDRLVARHLTDAAARTTPPPAVSDALFARRAYLDVWGLLPDPAALHTFIADRESDKRARLVKALLADGERYADHWMTFWNDLLRNDDGVSYFSERDGRKSITPWLLDTLRRNRPYDELVADLLNPSSPGDPAGFLVGVNWRGETSAAVTPWMQASQNTAQVFLGVNMKCNACHDSFVSRWTLKDAYGLAAYFSPEPRLQLYRCDVARNEHTGPRFPFPQLQVAPRSDSLEDRRAAAVRLFTDRRNGRLPRTVVNRLWNRLLGHGIVANSDEMDTRPWSSELLDWLASDLVAHDYDLKHLIATIMASQPYQLAAVARNEEQNARAYVFEGPEVRRLTAEQFADAIGSITGEWSTWPAPAPPGAKTPAAGLRVDSDPIAAGVYAREWRTASSSLTRALGRPIRDQVTSVRPDDATTPQALELVNGERLTQWLARGARRLTGERRADTYSRFNAAIVGRAPRARGFDLDISSSAALWLVVQDTGSNAPERVQPVWADAVLTDANGTETRLASLAPDAGDEFGPTATAGPEGGLTIDGRGALRVANPSVLRFDLRGRHFRRFRGAVDVANPRSEIGSTLNPAVRFFIFDVAPDLQRLLPPRDDLPLPPLPRPGSPRELVDRLFWHALGRGPSEAERTVAERAVTDWSQPGTLSSTGVADLLWSLLMKPEFQLIY